MICRYCAIAGDVLTGRREGLMSDIPVLHAGCQYPESCTCQHSTNQGYVNRV